MHLPLSFCLCIAALPAHAALPPCTCDDMISAAMDVVQLDDLSLIENGPDSMCQMEGNVVASFRGRFEPGQWLGFLVPCDTRRPPTVGPTIYHATDSLEVAEWIDVHFNDEGEISGYGGGLIVLEPPSEEISWRLNCV